MWLKIRFIAAVKCGQYPPLEETAKMVSFIYFLLESSNAIYNVLSISSPVFLVDYCLKINGVNKIAVQLSDLTQC